MENQLKLRVLDVKELFHFIVREEETKDAQRYKKLEKLLQKTYNSADGNKNGKFKVGSHVAVHIKPFSESSPKLWLRAVIKNIIDEKCIMYSLYLVDYGIEKCSHRSSLRELKPHFGPTFVPFQAFDFCLSGVEHKKGLKTKEVIKHIECLFDANNNYVTATIERRDRSGLVFGHILLEEDCDLASILIDKQLANDICCGNSRKSGIRINSNEVNNNSSSQTCSTRNPFSSSFHALKSTNNKLDDSSAHQTNSFVGNFSLNCKCNGILQYRRKKLRDMLKELETTKANQRQTLSFDRLVDKSQTAAENEKKDPEGKEEIKDANEKMIINRLQINRTIS